MIPGFLMVTLPLIGIWGCSKFWGTTFYCPNSKSMPISIFLPASRKQKCTWEGQLLLFFPSAHIFLPHHPKKITLQGRGRG